MNESNNTSSEYPQKIYDFLVKPDFREYLFLIYKEAGGDKELFSEEFKNTKANDYLNILFEVACKEYELQENYDDEK